MSEIATEQRPLSEEHEALLKTALKLDREDDVLPEHVIEIYWDVERTARRLGTRVDATLLTLIVALAGRLTPAAPESFLDVVKNKDVSNGDRVLAKFRNQWKWGFYRKVLGKKIVVQLDDDTAEEREFTPTAVRIPAREETRAIGESN